MDVTIVAAIITGLFLIAVAFVQYWLRNREKAKRLETEIAFVESGDPKGKFADEVASFDVGGIELVGKFNDAGQGEYRKRWLGLRTRQDFQNLKIPFSSGFSCPGGSLEKPEVRELPGSSHTVAFGDLAQSGAGWKGTILINGPLLPGSGLVNFELVQPFAKAYCMNRKEAEETYKNDEFKLEYLSVSIYAPTETLEIQLSFPPSHHKLSPQPSALAFIGETEKVNMEETKKVGANINFNGGVATLKVYRPVISLRYAIAWMPPALT